MRTYGFAAAQLPSAGLVTKGLAGQGANGTNINHVARELRVHALADKGFNFGVFTTVRHAQLHHTRHLLTKAHATGAVDAAAHFFHRNKRADVFMKHHTLFFFIA